MATVEQKQVIYDNVSKQDNNNGRETPINDNNNNNDGEQLELHKNLEDLNEEKQLEKFDQIRFEAQQFELAARVQNISKKGRHKRLLRAVILTLSTAVYILAGVFAFRSIEAEGEQQRVAEAINCSLEVEHRRERFMDALVRATSHNASQYNFTNAVTDGLEEYNDFVSYCIMQYSYSNGSLYKGVAIHDDQIIYKWSYPSAFLFIVTCVTTIGYGYVAPMTPEGQLLCMYYSLFGIPLLFICLSSVGTQMFYGFNYMWNRGVCGLVRRRGRKTFREIKAELALVMKTPHEEMTKHQKEILLNYMDFLQHRRKELGPEWVPTCVDELEPQQFHVVGNRIPITITLLILFLYLGWSTYVFAWWNNWSHLTAMYFIHVSLTTVGFGDYVSGYSEETELSAAAKLLASGVYIIMGLALLSMCIKMTMEKIMNVFHGLQFLASHFQSKTREEEQGGKVKQSELSYEDELLISFIMSESYTESRSDNEDKDNNDPETINKDTAELVVAEQEQQYFQHYPANDTNCAMIFLAKQQSMNTVNRALVLWKGEQQLETVAEQTVQQPGGIDRIDNYESRYEHNELAADVNGASTSDIESSRGNGVNVEKPQANATAEIHK